MKSVSIRVIPHAQQEYETVGNWLIDAEGNLSIDVSDLGEWRMNMLVGLHELIEAALCQNRGIPEADVAAFDLAMLAAPNEYADDPGHDPAAPYHREHVFAECLERLFAHQLGVNWREYTKAVDAL